ncbi:MAG: surface-adhesin E family protein [Betaproteobacteria bacterium]
MTRSRSRLLHVGVVLSLWTSAVCGAADWQRVPAAGDDQHFYDRSNVTISGDEVTYWRKVMFAKPVRVKAGLARSAFYRERVHCRDHTLRTLSWQLFADEGAVIEASAAPDAEAAPIVPETVGDRFQELVCGLADARRKRDADIAGQETLLAARRKDLDALKAEIEHIEAKLAVLRAEVRAMPAGPETIEAPKP